MAKKNFKKSAFMQIEQSKNINTDFNSMTLWYSSPRLIPQPLKLNTQHIQDMGAFS